MSKEAVLKAKEAEEKASKIILEAQQKADALIKDATERAEKDYLEYKNSLDAEYKRRVGQVSEDAEFLVSERRNEAEHDAEIMCAEAVANIPPTVREVVRRIMNECQ